MANIFSCYDEVEMFIQDYENSNCSRYIKRTSRNLKKENVLSSFDHHRVRWEDASGTPVISFTGLPFVVIGHETRECQYGPNRTKPNIIDLNRNIDMAGLPSFPKFEVYGGENSLGTRWTRYVSKLDNLFVGLSIESKKRKKALLLHYGGDDVYDIYDTLNLGADDANYDNVKTALLNYFQPRKNKEFERYEFRNMDQLRHESTDQYATRLRQKAENCEFINKENEIKSQIIQGCTSRKLRTKCLQEEKTLIDMLTHL